jgi:predicted nucleotidyltransferase
MPIDMIFGGPGLEDEFRERAIPVAIGGETVPIITPEDLLVTKILAGRPKDIEDARGLIAVRGAALDLERVRSLLGLLEAALSRSDLLRELDRLVGEAL